MIDLLHTVNHESLFVKFPTFETEKEEFCCINEF